MNDATESRFADGRPRRHRPAMILIAIVSIAASFAAGYRVGVARQEKRLLDEFLVNATRLGILDYERLKELADVGTNTEMGTASAHEREGAK